MNRRQFLGRFFQAVISSHTSNSAYGIYHQWRQYKLTSTLVIRLRYKRNDTYYDNIPDGASKDLILAVYDSYNTMIYCTAYFNGNELYNKCSSYVYLYNMHPGTYTIKCLCLGKGLVLGESGASMTVTIPDSQDRTLVSNNNYGYMSYSNSVYVDFIFGISGLYFEGESVLEDIGKYYVNDDSKDTNAMRIVVQAPSYNECKSAVNAKATALGMTYDYTQSDYLHDLAGTNLAPLNDDYHFKYGKINYVRSKIIVKSINGVEVGSIIAEIDLNNYRTNESLTIAKYWNICERNSLAYDPQKDLANVGPIKTYTQAKGTLGTDGSYEMYVGQAFSDGYHNKGATINSFYSCGWNPWNGAGIGGNVEINLKMTNVKYSVNSMYPNMNISGETYWGTSMQYFRISTELGCAIWMYGLKSASSYPNLMPMISTPKWGETIGEVYDINLPLAKECRDRMYNEWWLPAMENYDKKPESDYPKIPWMSTSETNSKTEVTYDVPMDVIFGWMPTDKSLYPFQTSAFKGTCITVTDDLNLSWGPAIDDKIEYKPILKDYITDLTEYDPNHQCNNSSMWVDVNNKSIFLRQTTIPIDMDAIPDHQITH